MLQLAAGGLSGRLWADRQVGGWHVSWGAGSRELRALRTGGAEQVTYAGFPLYYYAGDKKPGQANGQGFEKTWYVVNATGALVKHAVKASGSGGTTTKKSAWG